MSPTSRSTTAPRLAQVAELVHAALGRAVGSFLVMARLGPPEVTIGTWPVPPQVDHPADPLVGFLAPPTCDAIGLVTHGWASPPPTGPPPSRPPTRTPVRTTVLAARDGVVASVLERTGQPLQLIHDVPVGWVPDALARALARPTPPPAERLARWIEMTWLDSIAAVVLAAPGQVRSWAALAGLHPLNPPGGTLPGPLLAVEAEAIDLESSWRRIRHLWAADPGPVTPVRPPGGSPIPLARWFDDGSFCRWVQRDQPPAEALLPAVLDALPSALAGELLDALVTIAPTPAPP